MKRAAGTSATLWKAIVERNTSVWPCGRPLQMKYPSQLAAASNASQRAATATDTEDTTLLNRFSPRYVVLPILASGNA